MHNILSMRWENRICVCFPKHLVPSPSHILAHLEEDRRRQVSHFTHSGTSGPHFNVIIRSDGISPGNQFSGPSACAGFTLGWAPSSFMLHYTRTFTERKPNLFWIICTPCIESSQLFFWDELSVNIRGVILSCADYEFYLSKADISVTEKTTKPFLRKILNKYSCNKEFTTPKYT